MKSIKFKNFNQFHINLNLETAGSESDDFAMSSLPFRLPNLRWSIKRPKKKRKQPKKGLIEIWTRDHVDSQPEPNPRVRAINPNYVCNHYTIRPSSRNWNRYFELWMYEHWERYNSLKVPNFRQSKWSYLWMSTAEKAELLTQWYNKLYLQSQIWYQIYKPTISVAQAPN